MTRLKSKSKKKTRTVIGRANATRQRARPSKKIAVDDRHVGSSKPSGSGQGQGQPWEEGSLTPEQIRSVKKNIMAQRRAQRRRMGEVKTASEALSYEIDQYKQVLDRSRLQLEVLHKLPAVAWTVTRHGSCDFVNQFYLDATGLSADYCTAPLKTWRKSPSDLPPFLSALHPDHKERVSHIFWDGVRSGGGWTFEAPFRYADGSYRWHFDRAVPVRDARGKVLRFVGSSSDIQELRSERDALVDRERRLLAIIDGSPNPIFLKDPDGRFLLVNSEFEKITGVFRNQIIGKTEDDLSKLRGAGALRTNDREVPRSGEVMLEELATTDIGPRWGAVQKFPIVDADGRIYATAHITTEVTLRKSAAEHLRLAEDQTRLILDSSLDAVITIDARDIITGWSKSAEHMFGWSCDEAVGKRIVDTIIPMQYREAHSRGCEHFLATGEGPILNRRIDITALHSAGHEFPVELTVTAIRLETWHFTAFVRDLTDQRRVEEALRGAREELTRVTRLTAMAQLSASIAHEINQPLTAIAANSDTCLHWLSTEEPDLTKARAAAQRLAKDARRASDIIARIKALMNKTPVGKAPLDIIEAIRDVMKLTQEEFRKHRITTLADLHESVPRINGDRVQLEQVILNLVLNSIESMMLVTDRPRTLSIRSRVLDDRMVEISFHDTGVGFDSTVIDRLFDAFFTTKHNGTGMGLAICRSIIEAHDGQISVTPGAPFGAVFQFSLPIADAP
ncbi:PAS domain S-box-containing protein [Bradyrhizobium sp. JR1.5]|uniref:PAS domain-containing sensor histidine kinase n=1 Tax=unclassified Bradyrhizobium TaxID=2631580 RepID=UPI003398896B